MSRIVVKTPPQSTLLATLAMINAELNLTTGENASRDAWFEQQLQDASDAILLAAKRTIDFARQRVEEPLDATGSNQVLVSVTPVVQLDAVTMFDQDLSIGARDTDGNVDDPIDVRVDDPEAGVLVCDAGFGNTRPIGLWLDRYEEPFTGRRDYRATYWGGCLVPGDDVSASGLTLTAATKTITWPTGRVAPLLCSGERVRFIGMANSGFRTVRSRTDTDVVVAETLTNETPTSGLVQVRTSSGDWTRYCIQSVKAWYFAKLRDPKIMSERLADWSATYAMGRSGGADTVGILPDEVLMDIERRHSRMTY